jgi:lipase
MTHDYRTVDVPVRGGRLRVGVWEPADPELTGGPAGDGTPGAPTVLAIHGITATHRAWQLVAPLLTGVRIVAPDLRGRGRSNALPPPYGMATHADDAAAALDHLGIDRATVVGHSMGAYAAVVLHARHPDRVGGLVLVDGGLPIPVPPGTDAGQATRALLGPAAARLATEFPDRETYTGFWRAHPAFGSYWNDAVRDYAEYDLQGTPPRLRASTAPEVMLADSAALFGEPGYAEALRALPTPTVLLRAARGLLDDELGPEVAAGVAAWERELPMLRVSVVPDVNHYTVLLAADGAAAVAAAIRGAVDSIPAS